MDFAAHIPVIETERLRLRSPRLTDLDTYAEFRGSERARSVGGPFTRAQSFDHLCAICGQWTLRGYGRWIVADKATDAPLGLVGLFHPETWPEPEIGWSVFASAEGKGIAYEAALASRRFAYDTLGWTTVISLINPANTRSAALARRMGCRIDGQFAHETYGTMDIWRHLGPDEIARGAA